MKSGAFSECAFVNHLFPAHTLAEQIEQQPVNHKLTDCYLLSTNLYYLNLVLIFAFIFFVFFINYLYKRNTYSYRYPNKNSKRTHYGVVLWNRNPFEYQSPNNYCHREINSCLSFIHLFQKN